MHKRVLLLLVQLPVLGCRKTVDTVTTTAVLVRHALLPAEIVKPWTAPAPKFPIKLAWIITNPPTPPRLTGYPYAILRRDGKQWQVHYFRDKPTVSPNQLRYTFGASPEGIPTTDWSTGGIKP